MTWPSPGVGREPGHLVGHRVGLRRGAAAGLALRPTLLVAVTYTVYVVPLASPVTVQGELGHWCGVPLA